MNRPHVLHIDLAPAPLPVREQAPGGQFRATLAPWFEKGGRIERVGSWSGSALAAALLHRFARRDPARAPLVLAVGRGVGRGLPTAARASVVSRSPLTGRLAEGQIGGALAQALAGVADAVVLEGSVPIEARPGSGAGFVLDLARIMDHIAEGRIALVSVPNILGCSPQETLERTQAALGPRVVLTVGPAGEQGLPIAHLAGGEPGSPRLHRTGRGGLGAVFGRTGLKALAFAPAPAPRQDAAVRHPEVRDLVVRLRSSPRLESRSAGGTLELIEARAVREGQQKPEQVASMARDVEQKRHSQHGCVGCPTPCGWTFTVKGDGVKEDGVADAPRFGPLRFLGLDLGLHSLEETRALLEVCDRLGVDAKEVGAGLDLIALAHERGLRPGPSPRGDAHALADLVESLSSQGPTDAVSDLGHGAAALGRALGLEGERAFPGGEAGQATRDPAEALAPWVTSGGADPMHGMPILFAQGVRAEGVDPSGGAGQRVFNDENLASAVDLTGFCAFSAAGLLEDGIATLDELAHWIAPEEVLALDPARPGQALLAAGASLALLRREVEGLWGAAPAPAPSADPAGTQVLDVALEEYRRLRGLDGSGRPTAVALAAIGSAALLETGLPDPVARSAGGKGRGRVHISGAGKEARVEMDLPAELCTVLAAFEEQGERGLLRRGHPVPGVFREGVRLGPGDEVLDGDRLDLVSVISGG